MANEISLTVSLSAAKGGAAVAITHTASLTLVAAAPADVASLTQTFTATSAAVNIGSVAAGGLIAIKNLGANEIRFNTGTAVFSSSPISILAGEILVLRTVAALSGICNTGLSSLAQVVAVDA